MSKSNSKKYTNESKNIRIINEEKADEIISRNDVQKLVSLLSYMRPSSREKDSVYKEFLEKFIEPYFGKPDKYGNYIRIINDMEGNHPRIAYMAHHDTVHSVCGRQNDRIVYSVKSNSDVILSIQNPEAKMVEKSYTVKHGPEKGMVKTYMAPDYNSGSSSNCLGADCTTGVWLILEMIECGCPGVYVIHADEEIGCLGSESIVREYKLLSEEQKKDHWISKVDIALSFDRYGETSIITHQMSSRTASDRFADDLSDILGPKFDKEFFPRLESDTGGSYTDSNEYADVIKECSNLSVGYYKQHSEKEEQNVSYLLMLRDALVEYACDLNDPNKLGAYRDPSEIEYLYGNYGTNSGRNYNYGASWNARRQSVNSNYYDQMWDDDYYTSSENYEYRSGRTGEGYYRKGEVYFGIDENYHELGTHLSRADLSNIEDEYDKFVCHSVFENYDHDQTGMTAEEEIEMISSWLIDYPYIMASLLRRNGMSLNNMIMRLKDEAYRVKRVIEFDKLFMKDEEEENYKEDDDIPFDQNEFQRNILETLDTVKLLTYEASPVPEYKEDEKE